MARPTKKGLDYFPLDVDFLQDVKVRKIMRACGNQAISILISLLSSIYRNDGYYVQWDNDMPFLVADEVGASEGAVLEVVNKAIQVGFFDEDIFKRYKVLTSRGIQKRYLEAVSRRKKINLIKEYLLIDLENECNNLINEYNNSIKVDINSINDDISAQRKEKKSKVNNNSSSSSNSAEQVNEKIENEISIIAREFESNGFGTINLTVKEMITDLLNEYPVEWIREAMKVAVKNNKRKLSYVEGTLQNWRRDGGMKLGGGSSGTNRGNNGSDFGQYEDIGITI